MCANRSAPTCSGDQHRGSFPNRRKHPKVRELTRDALTTSVRDLRRALSGTNWSSGFSLRDRASIEALIHSQRHPSLEGHHYTRAAPRLANTVVRVTKPAAIRSRRRFVTHWARVYPSPIIPKARIQPGNTRPALTPRREHSLQGDTEVEGQVRHHVIVRLIAARRG
jgi:hypothetical protein